MNHIHFDVTLIPAFDDNYIFMIKDKQTDHLAVVDPGDAKPVLAWLDDNNETLDTILITHHHHDHTGGIQTLKEKTGCVVYGPKHEKQPIEGLDHQIEGGDHVMIGDKKFTILDFPGHTVGHIGYYNDDDHLLFCGDTLFAMGCGRLFEGTAEDMFSSLQKIAHLPDNTAIYCAHEYTYSNGLFAISAEPENNAVKKRLKTVKNARDNNIPTIPTDVMSEKQTNPFLRAKNAAELKTRRLAKDNF